MKRLTLVAQILAMTALVSPSLAMTLDEVFALIDSGVGEDIILEQLAAEGAEFRLETEDILDLKEDGASDRLLRGLIDATDTRRSERESGRSDDWTADYYGGGYDSDEYLSDGQYQVPRERNDVDVRIDLVYDPFGYHWYASPSYFAYYYPFRTFDVGFYYAGWHHHRWWGWHGYWPRYYRSYCDVHHYRHHHRPYYHSDSKYRDRYQANRSWSRDRGDRNNRGRSYDRGDRTRRNDGRNIRRDRDDRVTRDRVDRSRDRSRDRSDRRSWDRSRDRSRTTPDRDVRKDRNDRSRKSTPRVERSPSRKSSPSRSGGSSRSSDRSRSRARSR